MTIRTITLAALGLTALGATAHGAVTFPTPPSGWNQICYPAQGTDRVIGASDAAILVFEGDGNLAMYATNSATHAIWESGTAGATRELCLSDDGDLAVNNYETGATLWSRSAASATIAIDDDCDLVATNAAGVAQWTVNVTCPGETSSASFDGWCTDTAEETVLAASDYAELVWLTTGKLAVVGTGSRDGVTMWTTSTAGAKLCFETGGRLAIYATSADTTPLWTRGGASTSSQYLLGLDDCSIRIDNFDTSANVWASGTACSQLYKLRPSTTYTSALDTTTWTIADQVVLENDDAELVLDGKSDLRLRTRDGDVFWYTNTSSIDRLSFQSSDGNLVLYNSAGSAQWSTGASSAASKLQLDGCRVQVVDAAGTELWGRGPQNCDQGAVALDGTTYKTSKLWQYLLRSEDAYLRWEYTGNLCLYTATGTKLWCALSTGAATGNYLVLAAGAMTIYSGSGTALWSRTATGATSLALDGCKLAMTGASGSAIATLNSLCNQSYASVRTDGNDTFGTTLSMSSTVTSTGSATEVASSTSTDVTVIGYDANLFEATALQSSDGNLGVAYFGIEIFGDTVGAGVSVSRVYITQSASGWVGIVPVVLSASMSGTVSVSASYDVGARKMTYKPAAGVYIAASAGVGGGNSYAGASAGVKGSLTLGELSLPFTQEFGSDGAPTVTWSAVLQSMSGTISLYAEVFVKLFGLKISLSASKTFFSWTGFKATLVLLEF